MPSEEELNKLEAEYDPIIPNEPKSIHELVDEALKYYDRIEEADRYPIIYLLKQVGDDQYMVRVVAPIFGVGHPAQLIPYAARALRAEGGIANPDAAFALLDTWGYPKEVLDLINSDGKMPQDVIHRLWEHLPPSQHPDRVNLSICQVVYRDGHNESAQQTRGDESTRVWMDDRTEGTLIKGQLPEVMRTLVD